MFWAELEERWWRGRGRWIGDGERSRHRGERTERRKRGAREGMGRVLITRGRGKEERKASTHDEMKDNAWQE